jgi:hypothetical protein
VNRCCRVSLPATISKVLARSYLRNKLIADMEENLGREDVGILTSCALLVADWPPWPTFPPC